MQFQNMKNCTFYSRHKSTNIQFIIMNARCRNRKTLSPWQIASFIVILWHWKCPPPFKPVFKAHIPDNVPSSGRLSWYDQFPNLLYFLSPPPCSGGNTKQQNPKEAIVKLWNVTVETKFPLQRKYSRYQKYNSYWDFLIKMNMITRLMLYARLVVWSFFWQLKVSGFAGISIFPWVLRKLLSFWTIIRIYYKFGKTLLWKVPFEWKLVHKLLNF